MKRRLFFLILAASSFSVSHAQFKVWSYDKYKLKFKMMEDMNVITNDDGLFEAKSQDYYLQIFPLTGKAVKYEEMKNNITDFALNTVNFKYGHSNNAGHEQPFYLTGLVHYWGIALDGAENEQAVTLLLLVDPDNPVICYYITLGYRSEYYKKVSTIMNSFEPL